MNDPTAYSGIVSIAASVLPKTHSGQAVWQTDGESLSLRLPAATISIKTGSGGEEPEYTVSVSLPDGCEVGRIVIPATDSQYSLFQSLYKAAQEACWAALAREIGNSIADGGVVGLTTTTTTTTTPPPELPSGPTAEQAQEFFERIAGEWHMHYSRGQEDLRIDENGNIFVLTMKRGAPVATTARPKFRLELLACSSTLDQVEIAKVEPNGKTYQIEVLQVKPSEMSGYAKHDGHKLAYTRR